MAINVHSAKVTLKQLPNETLLSFKPTTTWYWVQNSNYIMTTNMTTGHDNKAARRPSPDFPVFLARGKYTCMHRSAPGVGMQNRRQ